MISQKTISFLILLFAFHAVGQNDTIISIYAKDTLGFKNYNPNDLIARGKLINNKKEGLWISYYPENKVRSVVLFDQGDSTDVFLNLDTNFYPKQIPDYLDKKLQPEYENSKRILRFYNGISEMPDSTLIWILESQLDYISFISEEKIFNAYLEALLSYPISKSYNLLTELSQLNDDKKRLTLIERYNAQNSPILDSMVVSLIINLNGKHELPDIHKRIQSSLKTMILNNQVSIKESRSLMYCFTSYNKDLIPILDKEIKKYLEENKIYVSELVDSYNDTIMAIKIYKSELTKFLNDKNFKGKVSFDEMYYNAKFYSIEFTSAEFVEKMLKSENPEISNSLLNQQISNYDIHHDWIEVILKNTRNNCNFNLLYSYLYSLEGYKKKKYIRQFKRIIKKKIDSKKTECENNIELGLLLYQANQLIKH